MKRQLDRRVDRQNRQREGQLDRRIDRQNRQRDKHTDVMLT